MVRWALLIVVTVVSFSVVRAEECDPCDNERAMLVAAGLPKGLPAGYIPPFLRSEGIRFPRGRPAELQGGFTLRFLVSADGRVAMDELEIILPGDSEPKRLADLPDAVQAYLAILGRDPYFCPATQDGKPVKAKFTCPLAVPGVATPASQ